MKIIETDKLTEEDLKKLPQWERDQIYNGLDCCVTAEVLDVLLQQLDNHTAATYNFSRELQGPALEMRLRGVLIDQQRKNEVIDEYFEKIDKLERQLDRIILDGVGRLTFNWRSNADLIDLFYNDLGIPVIKKQGRPTVDRNALERIQAYFPAMQIVSHILALKDLGKKISMLRTEIDPDGRMRTSYNIAGTSTGRFSSSFSEFGTGTNLQNVEESLRSVFIADPGYKMGYFDTKSGESFCVGAVEWNLFKDDRYLNACETGDIHTATARICWPKLPWTGDIDKDKEIAEQSWYRHYTYRFMCKKIGHGSNYNGQPPTLSQQAKIPILVVSDFQPKYFMAFPAHKKWHAWVDYHLRHDGYLISLTGRKRWFFGRRNDPATLREAIAYDPQGSLADILNRGMLQLWYKGVCILLMQIHDAVLVQYPEEMEDEIVPIIMDLLKYRLALNHGRDLVIPFGAKTGWNWGPYSKTNPDGLKDYKGTDPRRRSERVHILDRKSRAAA